MYLIINGIGEMCKPEIQIAALIARQPGHKVELKNRIYNIVGKKRNDKVFIRRFNLFEINKNKQAAQGHLCKYDQRNEVVEKVDILAPGHDRAYEVKHFA